MNKAPVKATIYKVNGIVCRFTGNTRNGAFVFSNHGAEIVSATFDKATTADIATYFGK